MRIGFAGAGNMAAAMARGWARAEDGPGSMIFADAGSGRAAELAKESGGEAAGNVSEAAANADLFVLAVKPTALDEVSRELGGSAPPLVSVLAGVTVATIQAAFPGVPVLRAMPNLPVEVGRGVVCYVRPGDDFPPEVREDALRMLESLGTTVPVEENQIEAATAMMSSSTPLPGRRSSCGAAIPRRSDVPSLLPGAPRRPVWMRSRSEISRRPSRRPWRP